MENISKLNEKINSENGELTSTDNFEVLLEDNLKTHPHNLEVQSGEFVEGIVIKITNEDVFLDIGLKTEGRIAINEFDKETIPKEGDTLKAIVAKKTPESITLSFTKAQEINTYENLQNAFANELKVTAKVKEPVKGGVIAEISNTIKAFIPISQLDIIHVEESSLSEYVGRSLECLITYLVRGTYSNIILSHRRVLQDEENKKKARFFEEHKEGDIIIGIVKNYASFGAFIDLGGFDGLLHVSDLGWGKNIKPSEVAPKGASLSLLISKLDKETMKINLSLKALTENPWDSIDTKLQEGNIIQGTVVKILPYGVFVLLDINIEGFVHISDMSWSKRIHHPNDILKLNSTVECKVLTIDKENSRISLGIKQVQSDPWDNVRKTYPIGFKVTALIVKVLHSGAILELEEGIKGFISRDNYAWNMKNLPNLKQDMNIECKVLGHDDKLTEIKLGIKQLEENPWENEALKPGTIVEGVITNITDFGIFLKINDGIEGLISKFQVFDPSEYSSYEDARQGFKKGQKLQAVVQSLNAKSHRLSLSIREIKEASTKQEIKKHLIDSEETHSIHIGDILNNKDFTS